MEDREEGVAKERSMGSQVRKTSRLMGGADWEVSTLSDFYGFSVQSLFAISSFASCISRRVAAFK